MRTTLHILLFFAGAALAAEELALPFTAPVEAPLLSIEAGYADVMVEIDPQAEPRVEARAFDATGPTAGTLERRLEGEVERFVRTTTSAADWVVFDLRVVVAPGQRVRIQGVDLKVSVRDLDPRDGTGSAAVVLDVGASNVELDGVRGAEIKALSSVLRSTDGRGEYALDVDGCRVELLSQRGALNLTARGGETTLQGFDGRLEIAAEDHRLVVSTAVLQATGKASSGSIAVDDWQGQLDLEIEHLLFEALTARTARSQLSLKGPSNTVTVSGLDGSTFVNLQGGSFVGRDLAGTTQAAMRAQGTLELQNVAGVVKVNLGEGSSARLADLGGRVRVATNDGQVEAERIFSLKVEATRSRISALDIQRQEAVSLIDSEIDLDMIDAEDASALILRGASSARVRIPQPCLVRVNSAPEVEAEQIQVAGCDFPTREQAAKPKIREAGTLVLTASLRDTSQIRVDGVER